MSLLREINGFFYLSHRQLLDLTGQRFGKLVAIKVVRISKNPNRGAVWLCECDCGNQKEVIAGSLRCGNTTSCGCRWKDLHPFSGLSTCSIDGCDNHHYAMGMCPYHYEKSNHEIRKKRSEESARRKDRQIAALRGVIARLKRGDARA